MAPQQPPQPQNPYAGLQQRFQGPQLDRDGTLQKLRGLQSRIMQLQMSGGNPMEIMQLQNQLQWMQQDYEMAMQESLARKMGAWGQPTIGTNGQGGNVRGDMGSLMQLFMAQYGLPGMGSGRSGP
jgi:hypothetical protein